MSNEALENPDGDPKVLHPFPNQYDYSAIASKGGTATVLNLTAKAGLEGRWVPPRPPTLPERYVRRSKPFMDVRAMLAECDGSAISSVAVLGLGGVGKTLLVQDIAAHATDATAGVIWQVIGPDVQTPQRASDLLREWVRYAYGGQRLPEEMPISPDITRSLLSNHGRLLIVLDDVWRADAVRPLLDAMPNGTQLLITVRKREVALDLGLRIYELEVLTDDEADALIRKSLGKHIFSPSDADWMKNLRESVGCHALALTIALGSIFRRRESNWPQTALRISKEVREGRGFGELPLDDSERHDEVERSLALSYQDLKPLVQQRFRVLGVFAPASTLLGRFVARIWCCPLEEASDTLDILTNRSLLNEGPLSGHDVNLDATATSSDAWHQHVLLRNYALALSKREDEHDETASLHVGACIEAIQHILDDHCYWEIPLVLPQARHAQAWALDNKPDLVRGIIDGMERLFPHFTSAQSSGNMNPLLDSLAMYNSVLESKSALLTPSECSRVQFRRAIVLSELAEIPGQNRTALLMESLQACGEALHHISSSSDPLEWAEIQTRRALVLASISSIDTEYRSERLVEALFAATIVARLVEKTGKGEYLRAALEQVNIECGSAFLPLYAQMCFAYDVNPDNALTILLRNTLAEYVEQKEVASEKEVDVLSWMSAANTGDLAFRQIEELMTEDTFADSANLHDLRDHVRRDVSDTYNMLGNSQRAIGNLTESLESYRRALTLQPDNARTCRSMASIWIDFRQLGDARAAIDRARELEPGAGRLKELEVQLAQVENLSSAFIREER